MLIAYYNECADTTYSTVIVLNITNVNSAYNIQNSAFLLYPNPAKEILNISLNFSKDGEYQLCLSNVLGQAVLKKEFSEKTSIDISAIPRGLYLAKIIENSTGRVFTKKVVVE